MAFKPVAITHTTVLVRHEDQRTVLQIERFMPSLDHCPECAERCSDCFRMRLVSRERRSGRVWPVRLAAGMEPLKPNH